MKTMSSQYSRCTTLRHSITIFYLPSINMEVHSNSFERFIVMQNVLVEYEVHTFEKSYDLDTGVENLSRRDVQRSYNFFDNVPKFKSY